MVNPGKRMHRLKELLNLRHGPGAARLRPEITKIHMEFARRLNDGHFGPRKFWRECLPRLKFWNPAIPMLVNRSENNAGPAVMSIYFRQTAEDTEAVSRNPIPLAQQPHSSITGETPAPSPEAGEHVVTIDMKNQHSDKILSEFLEKTGADLVAPTPDENMEMSQLVELKQRGAVDRAIVKKFIDGKRKEEAMLLRARREAEATKLANQ